MKFLRAYDIELLKLKDGEHTLTFEVNRDFFEFYNALDWVNDANVVVTLDIRKTVNLMDLKFIINGTVNVTCDRSLENFDYPLDVTQMYLYKFGPIEQEINEDMSMITKDTSHINVAQLIYEFILLAIPAKKIHPDYLDEIDEDDFEEEGTLVYLTDENEEIDADESDEAKEDKPADPRWEILNKLKKKD